MILLISNRLIRGNIRFKASLQSVFCKEEIKSKYRIFEGSKVLENQTICGKVFAGYYNFSFTVSGINTEQRFLYRKPDTFKYMTADIF